MFRAALLIACSVMTLGSLADGSCCTAADPVSVEVADLQDQLEKGLRATRPVEFEFIERVVTLVEENKLPVRLVYSAFKYARLRRPDYPFPYFAQVIRRLAKREGVTI